MSALTDLIEERLHTQLGTSFVRVTDDSAAHAGHAGNRGGGHFTVLAVSSSFSGLSRVQRHQRVYAVLDDLMKHDIHALSLRLLTEDEFHQQG
jgi:BolA protein